MFNFKNDCGKNPDKDLQICCLMNKKLVLGKVIGGTNNNQSQSEG